VALLLLVVPSIPISAADFDISISPTYARVRAGETASFTVRLIKLIPGFSNDVYLTVFYEPPSSSVNFLDNPLKPSVVENTVMKVITSERTPPGTYTITVRGRDTSGASVYEDVTIEVLPPEPLFVLSISPSRLSVYRGERANFTVTATPLYSFTGPIYLKLICPLCTAYSFSPNPMCPTCPSTYCPALPCAYYSSLLSIDTTNMAPGDYGVVVEGCSGSSCYRAYATLTVLEAPKPENINLIVYPLTLIGKPGDNLKVDVTISIPGGRSPDALRLKVYAPPGWYVSYYPTTFYDTSSIQLWISIPKGTAQGTYSMGIELYKGETLLKSRNVVIIVKSVERAQMSISIVPNEVVLTKESPKAQIAVLISSTGEVDDITLSLLGLPSGMSYSIPPKLRVGQLGIINLTLGGAKEGNYTASIIATSDGISATSSFRVIVKSVQVTTTTQETQTRTETASLTVTETVRETVTVTPERGLSLSDYLMIALLLLLLVVIVSLLITRRGSSAPTVQTETSPPS
ncbi:MAG: hypothetical protein NZ992_01845, partial [Candidatus Korarchaeum sp.]|nr:hypothetical protein [Candidatus Korarchaeum sp.]MDW8035691.1 hypothetical protein [Candidatus Korarchaeum sp.]